jgi:protein-disulfide isomerase
VPATLVAALCLSGLNAAAQAEEKPKGSDSKGANEPDNSPPPGVDMSKLDEFERKVFYRVLNAEPSACGKGHSLMYSLKHDAKCKRSVYAARYVVKLVDSGFTDSEVSEELQRRYRDSVQKTIDSSKSPFKGPADARVNIVEFVDYECPHCKTAQALMKQVLDAYPHQVRLYFKHFPLSGHTNSRLAAEAATAALKQGKFWPYNDQVWADSEFLTPAVLEKIAKDVGLDLPRWRSDLASEETKGRVAQDKSDGVALGINSTPTIYLNGRKYTGRHDIESISDWIDEELGK